MLGFCRVEVNPFPKNHSKLVALILRSVQFTVNGAIPELGSAVNAAVIVPGDTITVVVDEQPVNVFVIATEYNPGCVIVGVDEVGLVITPGPVQRNDTPLLGVDVEVNVKLFTPQGIEVLVVKGIGAVVEP